MLSSNVVILHRAPIECYHTALHSSSTKLKLNVMLQSSTPLTATMLLVSVTKDSSNSSSALLSCSVGISLLAAVVVPVTAVLALRMGTERHDDSDIDVQDVGGLQDSYTSRER